VAFTKGQSGNPTGRPKGAESKSTAYAREAIARFVDGNSERLQGWLDQIAEKDGPKAAFQCLVDLLEFHVPKLARTELTGKDGESAVSVIINHNHIHAKAKTGPSD